MNTSVEQSRIAEVLRADAERAIPEDLNTLQSIHERLQRRAELAGERNKAMDVSPPVVVRSILPLSRLSVSMVLILTLGVVVTGLALFGESGVWSFLRSNYYTGPSVPEGNKIRHTLIDFQLQETDPNSSGLTENAWTEERWFANGKSHLLMREMSARYGFDTLVGEDAVWTYLSFMSTQPTSRSSGENNAVWKTTFDKRHLQRIFPDRDVVDGMLQQRNTRRLQGDEIGGRSTFLLESLDNWYETVEPANTGAMPVVVFQPLGFMVTFDDNPPEPGATPTLAVKPPIAGQTTGASIDYRLWLDSTNYEVLRDQYVIKYTEGEFSGKVITYTKTLSLDELKDEGEYPADLFTFTPPKGTKVLDALSAFSSLVPIDLAMPPGISTPGTKP